MLEPGQRTTIFYPDTSLITSLPEMRERRIEVTSVRDLIVEPLSPETIHANPLAYRSRWLVEAVDELVGIRHFYTDSAGRFSTGSQMRIALYEPDGSRPFKIVSRGFDPTIRDRILLQQALRKIEAAAPNELRVRVITDDLRIIG